MVDDIYGPKHSAKNLTIAHVAQAAGVSNTTASLGLREDSRVKAATRKRILSAAARLGYRTNIAARMLASKTVPYIGMITGASLPDVGDIELPLVHLPLMVELGRVLDDRDFHLVFSSDIVSSAEGDFEVPKLLRQHHVSGILVLNDIWPALYQAVTRWNVPCVGVKTLSVPGVPVVSVDYGHGAVEAVNYLVELGHRRIAFLPEPKISPTIANKVTLKAMGYASAMHKVGLDLVPGWDAELKVPAITPDMCSQLLAQMSENGRPPTAILTYDDCDATFLTDVLAGQGLRVPQDVSIISLEDNYIGVFNVPKTTCAGSPWREMAENAVDMLLKLINNKPLDSYERLVLPHLIVRESTGPPSN